MEPFYHINSRITNNTPVKREPFEAADRLTAWVHTLNELNMSNSLVGNNTALDQHTQAKEKQAKQERERERETETERQTERQTERGGKEHYERAKQGKQASSLDSKTLVDQHTQMTDRRWMKGRTDRQTQQQSLAHLSRLSPSSTV